MKTCVVIPTYNESLTVGEILRKIRKQNLEALVIDDGSTDDTAAIARENGAAVISNARNEGKGASLIKGFSYALQNDFDAVITMDGDGQHLPEDIFYFMRLAEYSKSGVFIGNRMSDIKSMPLARMLTNKSMSWFISMVARQNIPDTQCGFRLIKKEVLERLSLSTSRYETESELLVQASRLGFQIESVPVKTVYRGEKSQINPLVDGLRFIRFMLGELWRSR